jgi:hypothetical protein
LVDVTINLKKKDLEELKKKLETALANKFAQEIYEVSQKNLDETKWPITTKLYGTILVKVTDTGNLKRSGEIVPATEGSNTAYVVYRAPYARDIEYGRPPGKRVEDLNRLKGWVIRKLGVKSEEADIVVKYVARKIYKEGTEPRPFLRDALYQVKSRYNPKR